MAPPHRRIKPVKSCTNNNDHLTCKPDDIVRGWNTKENISEIEILHVSKNELQKFFYK